MKTDVHFQVWRKIDNVLEMTGNFTVRGDDSKNPNIHEVNNVAISEGDMLGIFIPNDYPIGIRKVNMETIRLIVYTYFPFYVHFRIKSCLLRFVISLFRKPKITYSNYLIYERIRKVCCWFIKSEYLVLNT